MNFIAKIPVWQPRYWHREEGITNDCIIADETWEVLREGREEGRKVWTEGEVWREERRYRVWKVWEGMARKEGVGGRE